MGWKYIIREERKRSEFPDFNIEKVKKLVKNKNVTIKYLFREAGFRLQKESINSNNVDEKDEVLSNVIEVYNQNVGNFDFEKIQNDLNSHVDDALKNKLGEEYTSQYDFSMEEKSSLRIVVDKYNKNIKFEYKVDLKDVEYGRVEMERRFSIHEDSIEIVHDSFKIPNELQGQNIGVKILNNLYEQYLNIQDQEDKPVMLKLFANLEIGGYAWAKYGFMGGMDTTYSSIEDKRVRDKEARKKDLEARFASPYVIDQEEYDYVMNLFDEYEEESGQDEYFPMDILADLKSNVGNQTNETIDYSIPLGKRLLINSDWEGVMNLQNGKRRQIFENYLSTKLGQEAHAPLLSEQKEAQVKEEYVNDPIEKQSIYNSSTINRLFYNGFTINASILDKDTGELEKKEYESSIDIEESEKETLADEFNEVLGSVDMINVDSKITDLTNDVLKNVYGDDYREKYKASNIIQKSLYFDYDKKTGDRVVAVNYDIMINPKDQKGISFTRLFTFDEGNNVLRVEHDNLFIDEEYQKQGIGKRIFDLFYEEYQKDQENNDRDVFIELIANEDIGGYAWAKYGFMSKIEDFKDIVDDAFNKFEVIDEKEYNYIINEIIPKATEGDFVNTSLFAELVNIEEHQQSENIDYSTLLGKRLLLESEWEGSINLGDNVAKERLEEYLRIKST